MQKKNILIFLIAGLSIIKIILGICNFNPDKMHSDEERNYIIANNYIQGHNYSVLAKNNNFRLSAFHGSFTVLLYKYFIENGIKKQSWILFYFIISNLLFIVSLFVFYKICLLFFEEKLALLAMVSYGLYPSIVYYIGSIFLYENIALYFLIFIIYYLLTWLQREIKWTEFFLVTILVVISILFRGQMLPIFFLIFISYLMIYFYLRKNILRLISLYSFIILFLGITHYPILQKNYKMFGAYILSTQPGYELLQGHSPVARGGWIGEWEISGNPLYNYAHEQIPGIDTLNEYEESVKRKEVAIKWIKENPIKDLVLEGKKIMIFFLPYNFEAHPNLIRIHPINLIFHIGFIFSVFYMTFRKRKIITCQTILLLLPIMGSLLLTICFFAGFRWRFYAEPFMIIFTFLIINYIRQSRLPLKTSN